MSVSVPITVALEAFRLDQQNDTLTALRLLVEGVCDDVLELTPGSGVLERIVAYVLQLTELSNDETVCAVGQASSRRALHERFAPASVAAARRSGRETVG